MLTEQYKQGFEKAYTLIRSHLLDVFFSTAGNDQDLENAAATAVTNIKPAVCRSLFGSDEHSDCDGAIDFMLELARQAALTDTRAVINSFVAACRTSSQLIADPRLSSMLEVVQHTQQRLAAATAAVQPQPATTSDRTAERDNTGQYL